MANETANAQDLVTIDDIRDNTIILKNGGFRQVVMVGGVNFSLKSTTEQNVLTEAYQNFLNGLNFQVQVLIHSRKINVERYLATLESRATEEAAPLLKSQISEYREFVRGFVEQNAIMAKTFFVVVPFAPVALPSKANVMSFMPFGKKQTGEKKAADDTHEYEKNISQLAQRTTQVTEGLRAIGLEAVVLEDEALIELFYNFYNSGGVEKQERVKS